MLKRYVIAVAALGLFSLVEARAATPSREAKQRFANLVTRRVGEARIQRGSQVSSLQVLTPRGVQLFDARLTRFIRRNGPNAVPPISGFLPGRRVAFRQEFIIERFTPGATVGGVFFTTQATPFVPNSVVVFDYFPVFRI
jgi:hypothetical protein